MAKLGSNSIQKKICLKTHHQGYQTFAPVLKHRRSDSRKSRRTSPEFRLSYTRTPTLLKSTENFTRKFSRQNVNVLRRQ